MYDDDTMARIDRAGSRTPHTTVGRARTGGGAVALAAAVALGVRDVFEPPRHVEIEAIDPWIEGGSPSARVHFHWHPVPPRSVAVVRGW